MERDKLVRERQERRDEVIRRGEKDGKQVKKNKKCIEEVREAKEVSNTEYRLIYVVFTSDGCSVVVVLGLVLGHGCCLSLCGI